MVWYRAGSMDEVNGTTGVAHVLEHMMFKGTKDVGPGQFSKLIAAAGGRDNAFTSRDYTAYFQQIERSQLPLALRLEADRMANLILTEEEFAREIKVVMEERRWRTEDRAQSLVYEQLMATAFSAHPYRQPVIGWMDDLRNMRFADAKRWYDTWYAPNNALLVVVGDVQPDEVRRLAEQNFGTIVPRPLPERKPQLEPAQRGTKRVTVKAPAELPVVLMSWHVPVLRDPEREWEPYALEVLAAVLDGNPAARLNRALVREGRIANGVGAGYDSTQRGPGLFTVSGTPAEGRTAAELEAAIRAEISRVARDGVSEEELRRVKAQVVAGQVFQRDSIMSQAMEIGGLEMAGLSWRTLDLQLDRVRQVTAAQVQEVAGRYFGDDGLTIATLDPQPLDPRKPAAPPPGARHGS
jgi:zinc protease